MTRPGVRSLLLLLVLALVAAGCGSAKDGDGRRLGDGAVYVALGDSYTAGPGITPVADPRCGRSKVNYPSLVAKAMKVSAFHDRSCSSATTADLEQPQTFQLAHINDPQLDVVDEHTTLVTMGLGLNNLAISTGLLLVCLTPPGTEPTAKCEEYLRAPESAIHAQLTTAAAQVERSLEAIEQKAPKARVVLVGYPRIMPDQGDCPDLMPIPEAMVARLRDAMSFANQEWRAAAKDAGASYVDMWTPSEGHDMCSDDPWIDGYKSLPGKAFRLHTFANYQQAVADRIVSLLRK